VGACEPAGIPAFYTKTSVGIAIAKDKQIKRFGGQAYIIRKGIFVDISRIKSWKVDESGTLIVRKTARNFNRSAVTAGKVRIAEVEEIVNVVSRDLGAIHMPDIYVNHLILGLP